MLGVLNAAAAASVTSSAPFAASSASAVGAISIIESAGLSKNVGGVDSTGSRIWDAGRVLAELLSEADDVAGKRVLELGSGTGVGGLSAAAAGADHVVLTDGVPAALPLLEANVRVNELVSSVDVCMLRWGDSDDIERVVEAHGPFDLIVGSDLLYAPEQFDDLLETLEALCTPEQTEVLLAYPTRFTEDLFLEQAERDAFELVGWPEEVEPSLWTARLKLR